MSSFFAIVPIWVLPLFIFLLVLGLRARKNRSVPIAILYALPCLGLLSLNNLMALTPVLWAWGLAALGYAIGISLGMRWQRNWTLSRSSRSVNVKGEWVTMTAMMILFAAGFINGTLSALAPELTQTGLYIALFAVFTCIPAGQFLGRAVSIFRTPLTAGA